MIKQLFDYYLAHQDELVKIYDGKFLVITSDGVQGAWALDDKASAYLYGVHHFGLGNFLLQRCSPGPEAYTFYNHHFCL